MKLYLSLVVALFSVNTYADSAKIVAVTSDGKKAIIAQDSKGTPRINNNTKTYPTIKDFRDGYEFSKYCYTGGAKSIRELLTALVDAANGDGDSWSELISIKLNSRNKVFTVLATITDEGGSHKENYKFKACKK